MYFFLKAGPYIVIKQSMPTENTVILQVRQSLQVVQMVGPEHVL